MSFQPIIPMGGAAGWAFLQRTQDAQKQTFNASAEMQRDVSYYKENIGKISTAEELVDDYRLLKVTLGAYGLSDDINNKFFIQKVLEDGTFDEGDLANKLSDKRYYEMAKDFGFGDLSIPATQISTFADKTISAFQERQFEVAVGEQNQDFRLSLSLKRELGAIVDKSTSEDGKWFSIMGNPPLRQVFETALGLPNSFGALDLDLQLQGFKDKAEAYFGSNKISQFSDPSKLDELNRLFLIRSDLANGSASMASSTIALTLLQNL
ncbi:Protein of unknown function [Aliiroseovarius crassostreae]|uniref:Flagellar protein n=1 Tax=Aliiroseovarius crassostreae TaxID=154981 RepID=A0A0P7J8A2_9RHOB|nr:DUF1217 domain-containing protein [Aliiroseovarius crassostreae]KPN64847.1 flagellar protein [Aliiroseovarius crassostreae]SFU83665.1 Protein of unknown function [Aliiroseovarius crassostreae]